MPPCTYTLRVAAPNWQHTDETIAQATIVVSEDRSHIQADQAEQTLPSAHRHGIPRDPPLLLAAGNGAFLIIAR